LWINARPFWTYSTLDKTLYRPDSLTARMQAARGVAPMRVIDLGLVSPVGPIYPGNTLMAIDVPQVLGQHGLELRYFDEVLGGRNEWRNLGNLHLWEMLAVRWVLAPAQAQGLDSIPGFVRVVSNGVTAEGRPVQLFERKTPTLYARVVPAAFSIDSASLVAAVADPRMAYDRVVLLDAREGVATPPLTQMPPPSASGATVRHWEPGKMSVDLDPPPAAPSYLVVSENWAPDWRALVDGSRARVLRGNWTLITVPVPANARHIELEYVSAAFTRGKLITVVSLLVALGAVLGPGISRRWRSGSRAQTV
ncbi:MAG TPA: hypothetical protein VG454_03835, partial [Gemmatimonadales bacterium]|nr:hypothetical protein [Gemmatimonadales bacterium]